MKISKDELEKILESHTRWLESDRTDSNYGPANLRNADLSYANLSCINLSYANLSYTNLRGADLSCANLSCANLRGADLRNVDLMGANLSCVDLNGADLRSADLRSADLTGAKNIPFVPYTCPDFGTFTGFKKAMEHIVVLEIPEDAKRLSGTGRKCRCDKAKVLEIQELDGTVSDVKEVPSDYDKTFVYRVGECVSVDNFDENRWDECSTGIHFFINRQEAVLYR